MRLVVDVEDGTIIQEMRYDAWGNVIYDSNPGFQPFGFAGGLYDPQTRLVRFGARDYDASVGRWTAKDPQLDMALPNAFAYVRQVPVVFIDPDGEEIARDLPVPFNLTCGLRHFYMELPTRFKDGKKWPNDKFRHCLISCEMARRCGPNAKLGLGLAKEFKDAVGPGDAEWKDFEADWFGVLCAWKGLCGNCLCCCKERWGHPHQQPEPKPGD